MCYAGFQGHLSDHRMTMHAFGPLNSWPCSLLKNGQAMACFEESSS